MDIKDIFAQELKDLLKKVVDGRISDVYDKKFYTGRVIDNDDPDKLGRCKIRVFGVFTDDIDDQNLPWSTPDFNFIGSSLGSFIVPPIDAIVKVYFDHGEIYAPRYTTKVINEDAVNSFTAGKDTDYPNNMIMFETDAGEYLTINRSTYLTTYRHSSGTIFTIEEDGKITIDTNASDVGDMELNIKGDLTINATGDVNINGNNVNIASTLNTTIEATVDLEMKGINSTLQGSAKISMKHPEGPLWFPNSLPVDPASQSSHSTLTTLVSELPI